jgi:hypothetical protein
MLTNTTQRLAQALLHTEATETTNKTLLIELEEARETVSRLSVHHARAVGWEARLAAAQQERDDMQQERDSEAQRAHIADLRIAALKEKTGIVYASRLSLKYED